jgi:hypothetical protein
MKRKKLEVKEKTILPLDLPGGSASWLLAIDVSGSIIEGDACKFIANHETELKYKVKHLITFDTSINRVYNGMPSTCNICFKGQGGTSIDCVLGHALLHGFKNILLVSDGCFETDYKKCQGLNILIVKDPDGQPLSLLEGVKPLTVKYEYESAVEYEYILTRDHLKRKCRHCGETKDILLKDINFNQ